MRGIPVSSKMYKFEGEKFEIIEAGCSLEARLVEKNEPEVYGSVIPSNNYQFPFIGQLLDSNGKHISSQLARSVEEALHKACGFALAHREPDKEKACKDIEEFYDGLST